MKQTTLFCLIAMMISCSDQPEQKESIAAISGGKEGIIKDFIAGLWSLDSQGTLTNDGYLFTPDGSYHEVIGGNAGEWSLTADTLHMNTGEGRVLHLHVDSMDTERMYLSSKDESFLFRKVPFGISSESMVLTGFQGTIFQGTMKEYTFDLPTARKIGITLSSSDPEIYFRFFGGSREYTTIPVREWKGIMIRGGKYQLRVISESDLPAEYDLKVTGY